MPYRKRTQEGLYGDTKEMIEKCLHCPKVRCTNCLDRSTKTFKYADYDELSVNEKKYEKVLSDTEMKLLKYYTVLNTDKEMSKVLGISQSTVRNLRHELGLPIMHRTSDEERAELVKPWRRPGAVAV